MPPFAANQEVIYREALDDRGNVGLFVGIPFVSTRKHIAQNVSNEKEYDSDDYSISSSVSSQSIFIDILEFNACVAVAEGFASCSRYPTSDISYARPAMNEVLTCIECDHGFNKSELLDFEKKTKNYPRYDSYGNIYGEGELVSIDGVIDSEVHYNECAQTKQWRTDHARSYNAVMNDLFAYFTVLEDIGGFVDREHTRKKKGLGKMKLGGMQMVTKTFSSLRKLVSDRNLSNRTIQSVKDEETEKIDNVQTMHSSPTSLQYHFKNCSNKNCSDTATIPDAIISRMKKKFLSIRKRAKEAYSKKSYSSGKRTRKNKNAAECTKVRAVVVRW